MKATEAKLLDFLKKSPQFIIPIYQRTYSWTEQQCRQLWDDIMRAGNNDAVGAHFIGSWDSYPHQPMPVKPQPVEPARHRSGDKQNG